MTHAETIPALPRGGTRRGAGRPYKHGEKQVRGTYYAPQSVAAQVDRALEAEKQNGGTGSRSELITALLQGWLAGR